MKKLVTILFLAVLALAPASSALAIVDSAVKIVKSDATIGTTNKADTSTAYPGADAYITYGGAADVWGETWASTDINDSDFGVVLSSIGSAGSNTRVASIDHIRITVTYTPAAAPSSGDYLILFE